MKRSVGVTLSVAAVGTALLSTLVLPAAAQSGDVTSRSRANVGKGIPAMVDPEADLGSQKPGPEERWADSIYFTSQVKAGGHDVGILVHVNNVPNGFGRLVSLSVTDVTTGWHKSYSGGAAPDEFRWSTKGLDITAPGLRWTGNAQKMSVQMTVPWGSLDVELQSRGPVLNYGGTGVFPLLGDANYEYAFPDMRTTGTLTRNGKTERVVGRSWLDRQWGVTTTDPSLHWTWMNLNLPNGDALAIWDTATNTAENSWATLVHKDGSHEVVAVEPVADKADQVWTSPATGQKYPTRWRINIPALDTHLTVHLTGTKNQEMARGTMGRMEATAAFTGTYRNTKVTGKNYVEMIGDWRR